MPEELSILSTEVGVEFASLTIGSKSYDTYQLFVGVKGEKDLPGRKATLKDWVVYALVYVDAQTGEVKQFNYVLE